MKITLDSTTGGRNSVYLSSTVYEKLKPLLARKQEDRPLDNEGADGWEVIDGSDGEIVIRAEKESASEVTGLMRRVLRKKLTPEQLESEDFERIEDGKEPKALSILPKPKAPRNT